MNTRSGSTLELNQRIEYVSNGRRIGGRIVYGPGPFHIKPNEKDWCGVILDEPLGKNNGTVMGKRYFECDENYGIFVKASTLKAESGSKIPGRRSGSSTPASTPKTITPSSSQQSIAQITEQNIDKSITEISPEMSKSSSIPVSSQSSVKQTAQLFQQQTQDQMERLRNTTVSDTPPSGVTSPSHASTGDDHEHNVLNEHKIKIKDLEQKLETLKLLRAQDKENLKEYGRVKIQLEQLQENKRQMAEEIAELRKTKAAAEKEAKDAREEQLRHAEEMQDLAETAEMAALDKEMAEERYEQCNRELSATKEKLEEVQLDLEILRSEIDENVSDNSGSAVTNYQVKQLEQQNERLKEALLKLRDISAQDKNEINGLQKELEKSQNENIEFQKAKVKLSTELSQYEEQIVELKEQIDIALGSQEMVERLTEKNLSLEDKIAEMDEALDELETLRDLNNQLIESKDEQCLELREEIDMAQSKISLMKQEYAAVQETMADYEETIRKFRDYVSKLKDENEELRRQSDSAQTNEQNTIHDKVNVDFKIHFAAGRAFSRAIDLELRHLEVNQCQQHISFLSKFTPESFFVRGGDHEAIQVLLFVPRIMKKCEILERQILEKYKFMELKDINPQFVTETRDQLKQQIFVKQLVFVLISMHTILGQYTNSLKSCSVELFHKFGALFPELAVHEHSVDHFIELLKKDQLDETIVIEPLEKSLGYFQSLYNIHLADGKSKDLNGNAFLSDCITVLKSGTEAAQLDAVIIKHLPNREKFDALENAITCLSDIQELCKKIKRRLSAETKIKVEETVENEIRDCVIQIERIVNALKSIRTQAIECKKEITPKILEQFSNEFGGFKYICDSLQSMMTICCKLFAGLQQGDYDRDVKVSDHFLEHPIDARSKIWKMQTQELDSIRAKLESRDSEMSELKRQLKNKIDEVSEMQIRLDMSQKKLMTANKDADERVVRLQNELDHHKNDFKEKEIEFEKTLNHYQSEIDILESELRDMKDKTKILTKRVLLESSLNIIKPSQIPGFNANDAIHNQQIKDIQSALKRQCDENWNLRMKLADQSLNLNEKSVLKKCNFKPLWLLRSEGNDTVSDPQHSTLLSLIKKSNEMKNDINMSLATESIWDFKKPLKPQMQTEVLKKADIIKRYNKLEKEVNDFIKQFDDGYQIESHYTNFVAPQIRSCLAPNNSKLIATLTVPVSSSNEVSTQMPINVTLDQLKQLHHRLLP